MGNPVSESTDLSGKELRRREPHKAVGVRRYNQYAVESVELNDESYLQKCKRFFTKLLYYLCCCFCFRTLGERNVKREAAYNEGRLLQSSTNNRQDKNKRMSYSTFVGRRSPPKQYPPQVMPSEPLPLRSSEISRTVPSNLGQKINDCYLQSLLYYLAFDPELYKRIEDLAAVFVRDEVLLNLREVIFAIVNCNEGAAEAAYNKLYGALLRARLISYAEQMDAVDVLTCLLTYLDTLSGDGILSNAFFKYVVSPPSESYSQFKVRRESAGNFLIAGIDNDNPSSFRRYMQNVLHAYSKRLDGKESEAVLVIDSSTPEDQVFPHFIIHCFNHDNAVGRGNAGGRGTKRLNEIKGMFKKLPVDLNMKVRCAPFHAEQTASMEDVRSTEKETRHFRLHRMILHRGYLSSGHYIAAIRGEDGQWVIFDTLRRNVTNGGNDREFNDRYIQRGNFTPCLLGYLPVKADESDRRVVSTAPMNESFVTALDEVPLRTGGITTALSESPAAAELTSSPPPQERTINHPLRSR